MSDIAVSLRRVTVSWLTAGERKETLARRRGGNWEEPETRIEKRWDCGGDRPPLPGETR